MLTYADESVADAAACGADDADAAHESEGGHALKEENRRYAETPPSPPNVPQGGGLGGEGRMSRSGGGGEQAPQMPLSSEEEKLDLIELQLAIECAAEEGEGEGGVGGSRSGGGRRGGSRGVAGASVRTSGLLTCADVC